MGKDRCPNDGTTPICRCRVMYLGSSVPHATKDGLQGIQEPLRDLYPESGLVDYGSAGIDSWISVWSNGILIENVDDSGREMKRFFPIESLHYCAAVRYVVIPSISGQNNSTNMSTSGSGNNNTTSSPNGVSVTSNSTQQQQQQQQHSSGSSSVLNPTSGHQSNGTNGVNHVNNSPTTLTNGDGDKSYDKVAKFLPLDSPFLRGADNGHPPLFACILRRTTGIKVLECHAFICKREPAANALVRCCFHAYADSMYAKQIEENPYSHIGSGVGSGGGGTNGSHMTTKRSRSISALDTVDKADGNWNDSQSRDLLDDLPPPPPPPHHHGTNGHHHQHHHQAPSEIGAGSTVSQSPDEDNYKITWPPGGPPPLSSGHYIREGPINTMRPGMIGKPRPMIIHMGPPPHGGPHPHPAMMTSNHPPPFGMPIALNDHPHADKILKHSLKKKKKKSKSKMLLNGSSLLIGPGPGPFPVPVNFVQVPQISPQGSGHHHHLIHHPHHHQHQLPPPPSSHHHHPHHHNTIYGPLPIPPSGGQQPPPPPGSTAYSVRTRLRRGHPSGGGVVGPPPPGEYPIMFTGPGDEPIYIPPMRPLTPLSNYHGGGHQHSVHPHHQPTESHYVSYPVTYGTTPRREKYRSKDRINGVSRSVLGGSSGINGGHNGGSGGGGGTTGEDETERDSSPSAVGLYKRKGHLNERAFSYSIRQEHRSRSNSLANLAIDDSIPVGRPINGSAGGSGSSGGERGDEDHLHDNHHSHHHQNHLNHHHQHSSSSHHSSSVRHSIHHHDSRRGSSSAFGDRERERSSAHSSGHFDRSNHHQQQQHHHHNGHYDGPRDSFIEYRETSGRQRGSSGEMVNSLSTSMANLNVNGHSSLESKNAPKTASIKRSSKQRNSLGSKGMPIVPPLPPPTSSLLTNGNKSESKSMRKL
ncbi:uncharacterized protein LOC128392380 [Panonychus citri]|uniref:uncharacterized protein LOC128392380 n=1 Tax=Panonychus citri TaxID=50023 RepID=UPI0023076935|nr:uncharacterized protein LOC128392380 [Panonychus citri]